MTTQVITICSLNHSDVWKLTSRLIPEYISADEYVVFVPEEELSEFKLITDYRVTVRSQGELGALYIEKLRTKIQSAENLNRFGWYLQQFFKIEALLTSTADRLVIWDADCVPVKRVETFDLDGKPKYMVGAFEYNDSYFEAIMRLTGLSRIQNFSFVIPSFPITKEWICEFEEFVSSRNFGVPWYDAILETTDFSLKSGFSETETLGTFIANLHPEEWTTFQGTWERRGQKRFGYARKFSPKKIVKVAAKAQLDIVSFENWDVRGVRLVVKRLVEKWNKLRKVRT